MISTTTHSEGELIHSVVTGLSTGYPQTEKNEPFVGNSPIIVLWMSQCKDYFAFRKMRQAQKRKVLLD